jgi:hypothetical protein
MGWRIFNLLEFTLRLRSLQINPFNQVLKSLGKLCRLSVVDDTVFKA